MKILNKKIVFLFILIFFITISTVSAEDNNPNSNISLNTSDQIITPENHVYYATLQNDNNTLITNQSVIFSVNGINYTRLTDANGITFLNINLDDGVYSISTTFRELTNTNKIYISPANGTIIDESLSNSQIQKIIDESDNEATLIFTGKNYENIALTINKSLNIISIVKSTLTGTANNPVIKITANGRNSNISNIIIKNGDIGILIDSADNVGILNNEIINNVNGIYIVNSNNTIISKNTISNNNNGIYFDSNVLNTNIIGNVITDSKNNGISLSKSGSHTNISSNVINSNYNGILIDMDGDKDLNIVSNTIEWNENGINFGENYRKTNESGILNIYQNAIVYNEDFNILGRESIYNSISLRENYLASTDPTQTRVCNKIKFQKLSLNINQINGNTIRVSVPGMNTDFSLGVSYNNGKNWEYITIKGGEGDISVSNADGNLIFDYFDSLTQMVYQLIDYVAPTPTTPETHSDNNNENPVTNNNTNTESNGNGNGASNDMNSNEITNGTSSSSSNNGITSANNDVSSDVSTDVESASSTNEAAPQAESSASASASEPSSVSKSIAKTLNIDEEVVKIAGLGLIILLIIAIIGIYYRDDIKYMLNNRNE